MLAVRRTGIDLVAMSKFATRSCSPTPKRALGLSFADDKL
jgi:hypothetical protein